MDNKPTSTQKAKKAKMSVTWGDNWSPTDRSFSTTAWKDTGPGLTQIREIEKTERKTNALRGMDEARAWEALDEKRHSRDIKSPSKVDEDDDSGKKNRTPWVRPSPYKLPPGDEPDTYLEADRRGADSDEKVRQEMREHKVLQAQYLYAESIPDSAQEPEDDADRQPSKTPTPPVVIPLVFGLPATANAAEAGGPAVEPKAPMVAPSLHEGAALALFGNDVLTALIAELAARPEVLEILGRGSHGGMLSAGAAHAPPHQSYSQGHYDSYQPTTGYGSGGGYQGGGSGSGGWDIGQGSGGPARGGGGSGRYHPSSGDGRHDSHYRGGDAAAKQGDHGSRDGNSRYHGGYSSSNEWRN